MIRSCKKCKRYSKELRYCKQYEISIIDPTTATYCKSYSSEVHTKKNIKCCNCKNLNRYGYCSIKKRCFNEEEKYKARQCISFTFRKPKC